MYKQALDALIQNNSLPKSLMFYGECSYFRNTYLEKIASIYGSKNEQLRYYFDEYDFKSAKTFISQSSLFGDKNILIVKSEKTIPKKELEILLKNTQNNENSFFLFEYFGDDKKAKDITKIFNKKLSADFVRFFKPNSYEAINLLIDFSKKIKLDINRYAVEHLYKIENEDISLCFEELKKLKNLDKPISISDIDKYSFSLGVSDMESLMEKFFKKQDIKELINEFLEFSNANEIFIINSLQNYLSVLFMFYSYILSYGNFDTKAILGYALPPQLAKKRADLSIRIKLPVYKALFAELSEIELKLKTDTHMDKTSYFISSLIKLQTFL